MKLLSRSIKLALFGGAFATQPLGQVLNQLSQQTGTVIIAPSRLVSDKKATAATGELSAIEAVERFCPGLAPTQIEKV
jgi:iron complex outermembrane receptor protein